MSALAVVERLIRCWEARDADAIAACLHDDAVWHNMPHAPIAGRTAIRAAIGRFLAGMSDVAFHIHHSAQIGDAVVMNERTDLFRRDDGTLLTIRVAGVFEMKDGRIVAWRDYFDAGQEA